MIEELGTIVANSGFSRCYFTSNHASNYLPIKARLPRGKQEALDLIDAALRGEVGLRKEWMRAL
jgi:hypothetical protein